MIIGRKNKVAIECYEDKENNTEYVFGRMCIWLNNKMLGDINEPACILGVTELRLEKFLKNYNELANNSLNKLDDLSLFKYIDSKLYGKREEDYDLIVNEAKEFWKYDFLTRCGDSFDNFKSFIVKDNESFNILFIDNSDKFYSEYVVVEELVKVIKEFIEWYGTCQLKQKYKLKVKGNKF